MIRFILDLVTYYKFYKLQPNIKCCFFVENKFIYQYLKPYVDKRNDYTTIIVSLETFNIENKRKKHFVFNTLFFQNLFFLTLKINFLVTSTPDLENSIFKRSKIGSTKYIYIQHSPLSLTHIYDEKAFLAFDAVQVINKYQHKEINEINSLYSKKIKTFKSSYLFLKKNLGSSNTLNKTKILIAPTWLTNFYELQLHIKLKKIFDDNNIEFVLRPHPMSIKKKELKINELITKGFKIDISNNLNFKDYSNLITDWSGIFLEFSIINKRKSILLNTSQKIRNKNFKKFDGAPIEIEARSILGHNLDINSLTKVVNLLKLNEKEESNIIEDYYNTNFY